MDIQVVKIEDLRKIKADFWHLVASDVASNEILYSDENIDFIVQMYSENIEKFNSKFTSLLIVSDDLKQKIYYSL